MDWHGEKNIFPPQDYLPAITCTMQAHIHAHTCDTSFFPLDSLAPFWIPGPETPHAAPAISPRFLGSQDRFPIELLFSLKTIKSGSRPDPVAWPGLPLGGVHPRAFFITSLSPLQPFPLPLSFFPAGPGPDPGPAPAASRIFCCLHPHDVLTCYASASRRAYAYRSASGRSEAAEHHRGRHSNPVARRPRENPAGYWPRATRRRVSLSVLLLRLPSAHTSPRRWMMTGTSRRHLNGPNSLPGRD